MHSRQLSHLQDARIPKSVAFDLGETPMKNRRLLLFAQFASTLLMNTQIASIILS
jgi:hypothetical protein